MENQVFIENRRPLAILTQALNLAAKPDFWLLAEIRKHLPDIKAARRFTWEGKEHWDCGRCDSTGDKLDHSFAYWYALKIARRIQRGDGRDFQRLSQQTLGRE